MYYSYSILIYKPVAKHSKSWISVTDTFCRFTGIIISKAGELHILERHLPEAWVRVPTDETLMFDLDVNLMCSCIFVILLSISFYTAVQVFAHNSSRFLVEILCAQSWHQVYTL